MILQEITSLNIGIVHELDLVLRASGYGVEDIYNLGTLEVFEFINYFYHFIFVTFELQKLSPY